MKVLNLIYKSRKKRSLKIRKKLKSLNKIRLVVHKTSRHIYAQIISSNHFSVLVTASTVEKDINKNLKYTGNKISSTLVGKIIAQRALKKGIINVSFDRSGFKYHGRIESLANSARKYGLQF